ncbi:hypothetical protein Salat_0516000 [Sesamum alatum]|uniref:Uncharacterized protein n=1 Tax=Sesamum alatum TaxID=300844 RepID=A0AAE1Z5B6_9LAMI|nr:hypothetical protein Salat_0516000 [Sesamum alatum]
MELNVRVRDPITFGVVWDAKEGVVEATFLAICVACKGCLFGKRERCVADLVLDRVTCVENVGHVVTVADGTVKQQSLKRSRKDETVVRKCVLKLLRAGSRVAEGRPTPLRSYRMGGKTSDLEKEYMKGNTRQTEVMDGAGKTIKLVHCGKGNIFLLNIL